MPKLTKRVVDVTVATDKEVYVWDNELRGFGLRVFPSGRKIYVVQYRTVGYRQRKFKIGAHGDLTPDQARDMARQVLAKVAQGGDPASERAKERKDPTISDLLDLYLRDHAEPHQAARTVAGNRRLIEKAIRPRLGQIKVNAITRQDVSQFILALRETPTLANRCLAVLSKALNLAEEWGYRPTLSNPAAKQKKYPENHRERFLSTAELTRLGSTLLTAETEGLPWVVDETKRTAKHLASPERRFSPVDPTALNVIRVLLMTGARLSEITELKWEHVDFEYETLSLPRQKGKPRRPSPVSTAVMAFLARLPRVSGSPWVFPRIGDSARHISPEVMQNAWQRIRHHAGIKDVNMHDLRHTVGTWASKAGANAFAIRDVLRHQNVSMTGRYVNADADPLRELHNTVGNAITAALEGRKADVISIMDRRRQ